MTVINKGKRTVLTTKSSNPSKPIKITWSGFHSEGKVSYTKLTATKELTNNVLVNNGFGRKVKVQMIFDTSNKRLYFTDDFIGFTNPMENLGNAMNLGMSFPTPAILSEHGRGMKTAINWWGKLCEIKTSNDGFDFYSLTPDYNSEFASFFTNKSTPIMWYNTDDKDWHEPTDKTGTQIIIELPDAQIARNAGWFKNLKKGLEATYRSYIGDTLDIDIVWLENDKPKGFWSVEKRDIIYSSTRAVEDGKIDPKTNKPYTYLGSEKLLGPDTLETEGLYVHDNYTKEKTGIKIYYKIGYIAHPKNMTQYYNETKNPKYGFDIENFKENPFSYGSDYMGLSYTKEDVPIKFGNFQHKSRGEAMFGFLDIISGQIGTTKTKDDIVRTEAVERFEKDFQKFLDDNNIYVRSMAQNPKISEAEMEEKLLKKLRKSSKLRKYLSLTTRDFESQYALHSGIPDIVPIDENTNKPTEMIIELKKESSLGRIWKAVVQGMAYGLEVGIKNILIVAMDPEIPSDVQIKLDILEQHGWSFRYEQYQKLMEL